jgi:hypothetical protein
MSEIIDILSQYDDDSFKFTVNLAVDFVPVVKTNDGTMSKAKTAGVTKLFQFADHPILLSMGCILPLGFEFYENLTGGTIDFYAPTVSILLRGSPSGAISAPDVRNYTLPFPNYEMSLGQYIKVTEISPPVTEEFSIELELSSTPAQRISMINVPAALDGEEFHCPLFLKVLHTKEMGS